MNQNIITIAIGTLLFCLGAFALLGLCDIITDVGLRFLIGAAIAGAGFTYINCTQTDL